MDNQEAIKTLKTLCHTCKLFPRCAYKKPECFKAIELAISALQAQDSKTRKICKTCKHDPPSKKWPCVDCDMRETADRWEPKDVLDTNDVDMISKQAEIDAYIMKCPYFAGKNTIDRSNIGTHIGSCDLEHHYRKVCPSNECLCAERLGLKNG